MMVQGRSVAVDLSHQVRPDVQLLSGLLKALFQMQGFCAAHGGAADTDRRAPGQMRAEPGADGRGAGGAVLKQADTGTFQLVRRLQPVAAVRPETCLGIRDDGSSGGTGEAGDVLAGFVMVTDVF